MRELRQALRAFRREPAFVAGVVLTYALAVGANASMFGLVERLMIAPPPGVHGADRVVRVGLSVGTDDGGTFTMSTMSYPLFKRVAGLDGAFAAVAAVRSDSETVGEGAEQTEVSVVAASGRYFTALGVQPARGRLFGPGDDEPPTGNDVVVLGYSFWQRHFAGDNDAVGSRLIVNGRPLTVIGVAPRGFNGTELSATDLFIPLSTAARDMGAAWWSNPGMRVVAIVARLKDGVSMPAASAMVVAALRSDANAGGRDQIVSAPLQSLVPGPQSRDSAQAKIALWLTGVALVVLLIATANVGTLLQLRAARRRRDAAVRVALGAKPEHLARQALVESVMLAIVGAGAGLVLARWFDSIMRATLLPTLAPSEQVLDGTVLVMSLVLSAAAGLLAGLSPLRQAWKWNLVQDLHSGSGHGSSGRFGVQRALVGVQVALCTVLLVGAGLFVRSLDRVRSQDLGISTSKLLYVELDFRGKLSGSDRDRAHEDAVRRIAQMPGVASATVVQGMPFSSHNIPPINIPGYQLPPPTVAQLPILYAATPQYLTMMGATLKRGRLFTDRDDRGAPLVVIVNETMARTAWSGQDPIGKCVKAGHGASFEGDPMATVALLPCREVIGVVRDSRARSLRTEGGEDKLMQYYVPFPQLPPVPMPNASSIHAILVETRGAPERQTASVQHLVQGSSAVPVYVRAKPYQELLDPQLRSWRLGAMLFTAFGALALAIAAVGLYAAVSYLTAQRTREIGVRLALGGGSGAVSWLVVRDALRMAAAGAAAGVAIAIVAAPLAQAMLFQTSPREPAVVITAVVVLLAVTVGAAAVPAWRASRVSPMTVLRTDA